MLANLFKDERCQQLPAYGILEKMWVVPVLLLYSSDGTGFPSIAQYCLTCRCFHGSDTRKNFFHMGLIGWQCTFPSTIIVLNNRPYICSGGSWPSDVGGGGGGGGGGGRQSPRPWDKGGRSLHMCWLCTKYLLLDVRSQGRWLNKSFF